MKKVLLPVFFFLIVLAAYGQSIAVPTAEQLQAIEALPNDTNKVNRLNELAAAIQNEDPTLSLALAQRAAGLAEQLNYDYGLSVAYLQWASLLFYQTKLDSARLLLVLARDLAGREGSTPFRRQQALILQREAGILQQRQRYDSAVLLYQQASTRFVELGDPTRVIVCLYNLSNIYNALEDAPNALRYARDTRTIARQTGDSTYLLRAYMALADAFAGMKQYDSLYAMSKAGLQIASQYPQLFPVGKFHLLSGIYFENQGSYPRARAHFDSALQAFSTIQLGYEVALTNYHLGHVHRQMGQWNDAAAGLEAAARQSRALQLDQILQRCLLDLAFVEEQRGRFRESLSYWKEYQIVSDSVLQRNNRKIVYDLETRYQVQKKGAELELQKNQIRQKDLVNALLAGSVISVMAISIFLLWGYRQRRRLQEQRIRQLESEKQLMASEAIIKGEEAERGRLAKDLHDGLGGLLSGVKFSLTNMKSQVVLDADSALVFERSLDMLDHSISELRRVAHNMMPEVLVRFGLEEAIKSYCDSVRQSGIFQVDFQAVGTIKRFESNKEIIVYRILQELLNNAAKHAQATHVLVQLAGDEHELNLTVEDNGIGFDAVRMNENHGAGWMSIRSRVEYLHGKVDVQSEAGKGTSVQITISL